MANKTTVVKESVELFIKKIEAAQKRKDCIYLIELFREITGFEAKLWGSSMLGFGEYQYKYDSGHEGEWFITGFSPAKRHITIYIMNGFSDYVDLLQNIGKHKIGKSCLYIKNLENIDEAILRKMLLRSVAYMQNKYKQPNTSESRDNKKGSK